VSVALRAGLWPGWRFTRRNGATWSQQAYAFEKCACDGDMDTMAALYWFQSVGEYAAIHWLEWDDALAEHVGDEATYAELARLLTDRYVASQQRKNE
jgi:hypothetical protein